VPAPIKMLFQAAIRDARLSDSEKLVGLVLSTYMGAEGCAWPSVATLAHGANRSIRQTQRSLRELERAGVLLISRRSGHRSTYLATGSTPDTQMSGVEAVTHDTQMSGVEAATHDTQMSPGGDTQMSGEWCHPDVTQRGFEGSRKFAGARARPAPNGYADPAAAELARAAAREARRLLDAGRPGELADA
jgi:hypothetical protein